MKGSNSRKKSRYQTIQAWIYEDVRIALNSRYVKSIPSWLEKVVFGAKNSTFIEFYGIEA